MSDEIVVYAPDWGTGPILPRWLLADRTYGMKLGEKALLAWIADLARLFEKNDGEFRMKRLTCCRELGLVPPEVDGRPIRAEDREARAGLQLLDRMLGELVQRGAIEIVPRPGLPNAIRVLVEVPETLRRSAQGTLRKSAQGPYADSRRVPYADSRTHRENPVNEPTREGGPPVPDVDYGIEASRIRSAVRALQAMNPRPIGLPRGEPGFAELRAAAERRVTAGMDVEAIGAEVLRIVALKAAQAPGRPISWRFVLDDFGSGVSVGPAPPASVPASRGTAALEAEAERQANLTPEERAREALAAQKAMEELAGRLGRGMPAAGPEEPGPAKDREERETRMRRRRI